MTPAKSTKHSNVLFLSLPAGSHVIRAFPGLNGIVQGSRLFCDEPVEVVGDMQTVDIVWKVADLTVPTATAQDLLPIPAVPSMEKPHVVE